MVPCAATANAPYRPLGVPMVEGSVRNQLLTNVVVVLVMATRVVGIWATLA